MRQALLRMLTMQHHMNQKVHPEWIAQNFAWYRAVWIECAELMDHIGYKWWKHQALDNHQMILEIIDIWHFGMSAQFQPGQPIETIATDIEHAFHTSQCRPSSTERQPQPPTICPHTLQKQALLTATEALAQHALDTKTFSIALFWDLMTVANVDFNTLYTHYIGKNILNIFRQDNGYKEGYYIKQWQGKEDNEHLSCILMALDSQSPQFDHHIYQALQMRYNELVIELQTELSEPKN